MKVGISIDQDKCNYCMECVEACMGEALTEDDGAIVIDNTVCEFCESCTYYCDALTLTLENGSVICR